MFSSRLTIFCCSGCFYLLATTSQVIVHHVQGADVNDPFDDRGSSTSATSTTTTFLTYDEQDPPLGHRRKLSTSTREEIWNGMPLTQHRYHNPADGRQPEARPLTSTVHCVGENHSPAGDAWRHRSCHFRNLCWSRGKFVAVESVEERRLRELLEARSAVANALITVSSMLMPSRSSLSLGSNSTSPWFPSVRTAADGAAATSTGADSYRTLPESVVLVPASLEGSNPRDLLWNALYPIYTLLSLFELESYTLILVLMRISGDQFDSKLSALERFRTAMGGMVIVDGAAFQTADGLASDGLVCSKHAAAGLGLRYLQDEVPDKFDTQSSAEGLNLWSFRSFLSRNLGLPQSTGIVSADLPLRLTFPTGGVTVFDAYEAATRTSFNATQVQIQRLDLRDPDLARQAHTLATSHVLVTDVWDEHDMGLVTFLPRQSILLLVVDTSPKTLYPTRPPLGLHRTDWELLHMAGYFQTRVLPLQDHERSVALMIQTLTNALELTRAQQR